LLAAVAFQFIYPIFSAMPHLGWRVMFWIANEEGVGWSGVMKKRRKNPHAVALGRLGGLVRSAANRENGRKGGLVESRKKRIASRRNARHHGRDAGRRGKRGGRLDSRPVRISG
jgi:hypothetical protein